jgi:uncharacterized protein with PIN domain
MRLWFSNRNLFDARISIIITTGKRHSRVYAKRSTSPGIVVALCADVLSENVTARRIPMQHRLASRISVDCSRCRKRWWVGELQGDMTYASRRRRMRNAALLVSTRAMAVK